MIRLNGTRCLLVLAVALIFVVSGCKGSGSDAKSAGISYDPRKDPLVNPPSLFQPPPDNTSQIATDETLFLTLRANPNTLNPLFVSSVYDFIVVDTTVPSIRLCCISFGV